MTMITNGSALVSVTDYVVDLTAKTVELKSTGSISTGSANGVTGSAVFTALELFWNADSSANRYRFPFAISDGPSASMLELRGGWQWKDAATISLLRDAGFSYSTDFSGQSVTEEYVGIKQLGTVSNPTDQPYYLLGSATVPTNFGVAGEFNECVKVYDSAGADNRSALKIYIRESGDTYASYDLLSEQNLSALLPKSYAVPLSTTTDLNAAVVSPTGVPYSGMSLVLGSTTNTINSTSYSFSEGFIDAALIELTA